MIVQVRPVVEVTAIVVALALGVLALAAMVSGCKHGPSPGETRALGFGAELESCLQKHDEPCAYIACRRAVQAAHGQPVTGECVTDGGAP